MNRYGYVGGDPVNFVDPRGLEDDPRPIVVNGDPCRGGWVCGGFNMFSLSELVRGPGPFDITDWGAGNVSPVKCTLGNGAIDVSFDGTNLSITARMNLVGPGAPTSGAYPAGIAKAWTTSPGRINSTANISAGPGGITGEVSSGIFPPGGARSVLGGNYMWIGNLGAMTDLQMAYATQHVVPHEFGHSLGIPNMPPIGKWANSIMANSGNKVSEVDLEAVVELCRAAAQ
ncbi:MAG TPA: hypothetical protein VF680_10275 [Allosphingosinicella sp.]|jgi:hypothetical protein